MATRGTISVQMADGSVATAYSHWDNYLECNGKILLENYNTLESARELVSHGAISSLRESIGVMHDFDDKSEDNGTTFYHRDRGEPLRINTYNDLDEYEKEHQYEEYSYIMTNDGVWSVFFRDEWHDLEYIMQEKEKDAA